MTQQQSTSTDNQETDQGLPEIASTSTKNPWIFVLVGIFVLGIGLFISSGHSNKQTITNNEAFAVEAEAPKLNTPQLTPQQIDKLKALAQKATLPPPASTPSPEQQKALLDRLHAPIMMIDNSNLSQAEVNNKTNPPSSDPNTRFLNQTAAQNVETANATVLQHLDQIIAQGNLIHAVLETAINSDLPGYLRAIVSQPVYSEDGEQVLIPPGSRLIGLYKSGMLTGQSRIFAVWTRIIEPNGTSILLGSPGVDNLGMAGMGADYVDRHFWQMFGTSALLSLMSASASTVGVNPSDNYNAAQSYRQAVSDSLSQSSSQALKQNGTIPPTIKIDQGKPIMVFVAKDLNFGTALQKNTQGTDIF